MGGPVRKGQVSEASRRFLAWPRAQRVAASDACKATPRQYVGRGAVRTALVSRTSERSERSSPAMTTALRTLDLRSAYDLELLHPASPVGLRDVDVAL